MRQGHPEHDRLNTDPDYQALKRHIIQTTGLSYYADRDLEFAGQAMRRMAALRIEDYGDYLSYLMEGRGGASELDTLTASLTIGETFFFRHQELFDALVERVIPELIERNRESRCLRIWSAGCSIGAEPYSLAILLHRDFSISLAGWDVTIVGTDINRHCLVRAERGRFGQWHLRTAPQDLKVSCFVRSAHAWTLKDKYRQGVIFRYHNLVRDPFPDMGNGLAAFDLILCRNVMIYFEAAITRRLVRQFHDSLVDGGWFVVGPSEPSVELFRAFQTVNVPGAVLYQVPPASSKPSKPQAPEFSNRPDVTFGRSRFPDRGAKLPNTPTKASPTSSRPKRSECRLDVGSSAAAQVTLSEARARLNGGSLDTAMDCCRRLLANEELNPWVHYYFALAAGQQGQHLESEQAFRRAIYLDREFALAHYHLALLFKSNDDCQSARRRFQHLLQLLRSRRATETLNDADGLTVGQLRQLAQMQLEVLACA